MNTARLVVSGHISPGCTALDVDPTFGSEDEWHTAMQDFADATPEELEATLDYESWMEDTEWIRQGC